MRHSTAQNSPAQNAGVDISKDTLDVCLHSSGAAKRFTNDGKGHRALIAWLAPSEIVRIVFEATGAYHYALMPSPLHQPNPVWCGYLGN